MDEKLFMMSKKFNLASPEEFGLLQTEDPEIFILPSDNSLWKKRALYDYGWGKENGFYRLPMPKFNDLIDVILNSEYEENKYGAAAIILDDYCDELLNFCQEIFKDSNTEKYMNFIRILQLDIPINRSPIFGKSYQQISGDYERWKAVTDQIQKWPKQKKSCKALVKKKSLKGSPH